MTRETWLNEWRDVLLRVQRELTRLDADERLWLEQRLAQVVEHKRALQRLFVSAGGVAACRACDGACCARGHHHMTLVEVLCVLRSDSPLPDPDPLNTCPFLTPSGCSLAPELRPFNCVTFNCEAVEGRLSPEQVATFYRLEKELRALYAEFEAHFAGASLRGVLIRAQRLGGGALLGRPSD